jgi:hypothetical protein
MAILKEVYFKKEYNKVLKINKYKKVNNPNYIKLITENLKSSFIKKNIIKFIKHNNNNKYKYKYNNIKDRDKNIKEENAYLDFISCNEIKKGFEIISKVYIGWIKVRKSKK